MWLNGFVGIGVQPVGSAAHHRHHRMAGLTGQHDVHHARDSAHVRVGSGVHRGLGGGLNIRVQCGPDQIAASSDLFFGQAGPGQKLLDVIAEERAVARCDATAGQFVGPGQNAERLLFGGAQFVCLVGKLLDHGVEHQVSPGQRPVRVGVRVERAGGLHQARQQRRLLPVQVDRVDSEIRLRGVLDAEGAVAERHQIEVAGEDLRLGERLVQRQRHPDLAQLTGRCLRDRRTLLGIVLGDDQKLVVLDVLLFEGRTTASARIPGGVSGQAGESALPVHPIVLGEPFVLDRDDRQLHRVGDLVAGNLEPAL